MEEGNLPYGEELESHIAPLPPAASLNVWAPRSFPPKLLLNKGLTSPPVRQWADAQRKLWSLTPPSPCGQQAAGILLKLLICSPELVTSLLNHLPWLLFAPV